jgi:hypothetical protein
LIGPASLDSSNLIGPGSQYWYFLLVKPFGKALFSLVVPIRVLCILTDPAYLDLLVRIGPFLRCTLYIVHNSVHSVNIHYVTLKQRQIYSL